ncbi:MAG TPA: hypothetical protein PKX48_14060 [Planctomycetota bacterium]|jgi:hypothetical protein|nr:hypothetical protein [Planctomycetota bacterium]OQC19545.1 MAG: hypothetical protein BWX69_02654 [Planctomycetes bacterium ADurb.Bin069]NMD36065.1 hypothetical protein [Planctomycetota bacterium]HNR99914.1 hypothetical protein [Planctomycetota bacterium]HNU26430.1 hypothetical protein [Planctomycetota bacterium]
MAQPPLRTLHVNTERTWRGGEADATAARRIRRLLAHGQRDVVHARASPARFTKDQMVRGTLAVYREALSEGAAP